MEMVNIHKWSILDQGRHSPGNQGIQGKVRGEYF